MHELLRTLIELTIVSSGAVVIVLAVRRPLRRVFGARLGYAAWLLVPIAIVAALLPGVDANTPVLRIPIDITAVVPLNSAADASLVPMAQTESNGLLAINWPAWMLTAWAAGALLFVAYLIGAQRAFVRGLGALSESGGTLRAEQSVGCP